MTITLTGQIQCLDGRFRVFHEIRLPCDARLNQGDKICFADGFVMRVTNTGWAINPETRFAKQLDASISFDATKLTSEEAKELFTANGFEVEEVE